MMEDFTPDLQASPALRAALAITLGFVALALTIVPVLPVAIPLMVWKRRREERADQRTGDRAYRRMFDPVEEE